MSDEYTVPLCLLHHRELHDAGNEREWWAKRKIDPLTVAYELWAKSRLSRKHTDSEALEPSLDGTSQRW